MSVKLIASHYTLVVIHRPPAYQLTLYAAGLDQVLSTTLQVWPAMPELPFALRQQLITQPLAFTIEELQQLLLTTRQHWQLTAPKIAAVVVDEATGINFSHDITTQPLQAIHRYLQQVYARLTIAETDQDDLQMRRIRKSLLAYLAENLTAIATLSATTASDTRLFADLIHGLNLLSPTELMDVVIMGNYLATPATIPVSQQWQPLHTLATVEQTHWETA